MFLFLLVSHLMTFYLLVDYNLFVKIEKSCQSADTDIIDLQNLQSKRDTVYKFVFQFKNWTSPILFLENFRIMPV